MSALDLIEFRDGIHVRVTPRLPVPDGPHFPGDILRCNHGSPLIVDLHQYGYRLAMTEIAGVEVVRGVSPDNAPKCGCWLLLATGTIEPMHQRMLAAIGPTKGAA